MNEHYHSIHGAIQESKHVFIEAGLKFISSPKINILEIGFGTGLNAILSFIECKQQELNIHYTALEAFPLESDITKELNYTKFLGEQYSDSFQLLHTSEWEKEIPLSENFVLKKIKNTLQEIILQKEFYNLIYFDAFGPPVQPEMWTEELFTKIYNATATGGILVTYCAKGEVKRTLKKVGFEVESLKGPPGKREMVRAKKL